MKKIIRILGLVLIVTMSMAFVYVYADDLNSTVNIYSTEEFLPLASSGCGHTHTASCYGETTTSNPCVYSYTLAGMQYCTAMEQCSGNGQHTVTIKDRVLVCGY